MSVECKIFFLFKLTRKHSAWVVRSQGWNSKELTEICTCGGTCDLMRNYAQTLPLLVWNLSVFLYMGFNQVLHGCRKSVLRNVRLIPLTDVTLYFNYVILKNELNFVIIVSWSHRLLIIGGRWGTSQIFMALMSWAIHVLHWLLQWEAKKWF